MSVIAGIDIGGTSVKGLLLSGGKAVFTESVPTDAAKLAECAAALVKKMCNGAGVPAESLQGVGAGCPGMVDSSSGTIVFSGNLNLKNYPLAEKLHAELGVPVRAVNDANAAALGEAKYGAGKDYADSVFITLGTGVGGGVIIGGKLFEGYMSAGTEIGHMVIERGGDRCTCGRRGCFEAYASATALIRRTKWAMEENPGSLMWRDYTSDTATGKTAFDYPDDAAANEVVDWYIKYLGCGIVNLANIFRPNAIILGGGVAAQGDRLIKPLQKLLDGEIFGGNARATVRIVCASLGASAGAYGAAALFANG